MIKNNLSLHMGMKRITVAELARVAGLDYKTVFNLYHDKRKGIEFDTLNKLCWALDRTPDELFEYVPDRD